MILERRPTGLPEDFRRKHRSFWAEFSGCVTLALLLFASPILAAEPADAGLPEEPAKPTAALEPPGPVIDAQTLEHYRTPFEALNDRKIGEASRAVRFDWRKKTVGFGIVGSDILELNNFSSTRFGGFARAPVGSFMVELAVSWVFTWAQDSAQKLALTPYRQYGRPSRLEIDINLAFPLAEGVATARPGFFPATEFVFSIAAGVRYLYYPGSMAGFNAGDVATALFSTKLWQREYDNLDDKRLPAMQIDGSRYSLLIGFVTDIYFQLGIFISPRVMVGLPVFSAVNRGGLGAWWELSLSAGWAL